MIGKLFVVDWRRILKSPFAFLLLLALLVIPSLYCWFNVWALWNPYGNTQNLKVAVYSADSPAEFQGQQVAIGKQLITQLHKNKKLGWRFVDSKQDAVDGVRSGRYYASVVVPKNFSKNLLTFVQGKIQKPTLQYYVNEKVNAVAPKITDSGASTLQATISKQFVTTVADTLTKAFNQAGVKLDANLPMIRRFASLVTDTNDQLPVIQGYLTQVDALHAQMPALKAKLAAANQLAGYLPAVNQMAQKLVGAGQFLPMVDDAGQLAVAVKGKLPEVQQAGRQLNTVNANFDDISKAVVQTTAVTKNGLTLIDSLDGTLPALTRFGQNAQAVAGTTKDQVLPQLKSTFTTVQHAADAGLALIQAGTASATGDMTALNQQLQQLQQSPASQTIKTAMIQRLQTHAQRQGQIAATAQQLADTLTQLKESGNDLSTTNSSQLDTGIARLQSLAKLAAALQTQASQLAQALPNLTTAQLQSRLQALVQANNGFAQDAKQLQGLNLGASIQTLLNQFETALASGQETLTKINRDVLPKMPQLLASTKSLLQKANRFLGQVQTQLPALKQELQDADTLLNGHMQLIQSGITTAANLYQNDFPDLKVKLNKAAGFINNDLPAVENELTQTMNLANQKMPQLETGLNQAHQLIHSDWPTLKDAIQKGSAAIKKGEKRIDLSELMKLLRRDAGKEANFLAAPVTLSQRSIYPIPTYGSQSAPFYLALCIWVGALLLGAIIMTEFNLPEDLRHATIKQTYTARWLTFAGLGMLQALIAACGNLFLIHTYVVNKPLYVLGAMFLSLVFVSILYPLISLFGNIGKGLGIIILVLSISGAGGNFPVVMSGRFFQAINPWLPFTYAVNLLRETVGGIYWPNMWRDILALLAFGLLFFLGGLFLKAPIRPWIDKMHAITRKSKLIE